MLQMPETLLTKLQCGDCKHIISCGPVYTKKDNQNSCGRCLQPENLRKQLPRNLLYEDIAAYLNFPCKYFDFGCKVELKWNESVEHEKKCVFRRGELFSCPLIQKCSYKGLRDEIVIHCSVSHPTLIVKHPFQVLSYSTWIVEEMKNLRNSSFKNMFIIAHGCLFKIHFKLSFTTDNILLYVSYIGDLKLAAFFEFHVEVKNQIYFKKNLIFVKQVVDENEEFNEQLALTMKMNDQFSISIERNNTKCLNCHKEFLEISLKNFELCCDKWSFVRNEKSNPDRELQRCLFYEKGCTFFDIPLNIKKHECFLCRYSLIQMCDCCEFVPCEEGKSTLEHLEEAHLGERYFGKSININSDKLTLFDRKRELLITENGKVIWEWGTHPHLQMEGNLLRFLPEGKIIHHNIFFHVRCFTDIPTYEEDKLKFKIKLKFLNKGKVFRVNLKKEMNPNLAINIWSAVIVLPICFIQRGSTKYSLSLQVE